MIARSLVGLIIAALAANAAMSKHIASYDIKASLDHGKHVIHGSETLTWVNDSPDTVPTLQFHLYMNAFRNSRSTFFKESGGQLRGDKFKGDEWGSIDVRKMQLVGGADLTKLIKFIHPDDTNTEDMTVIEVALPEPVKPGATIQVAIDFDTKMPTVFARTGFHKDYYLVGQWFPKIGVWETAGFRYSTKGAWNCHQFHANSEFFANFGKYRVELTVPSNMVIGATGEQRSRADNASAKTSTYTFEQEDVTDFAWTVQPTYIRVERMFEAAKETTPQEIAAIAKIHGIPESEVQLSDVKMIALIQPEHASQIERHFHGLRMGLKYFGLWYGRYPYKTITVVDPVYGAGGSGGMEYPTFITAGTSYTNPQDFHSLEEVVVHEFGHQFWMQLVATNEFEESSLDEGFNTFSTGRIMDKVYGGMGRVPLTLFGVSLSGFLRIPWITDMSMNRAATLVNPDVDNMIRKSWQYYDSNSYGLNSYMRMGATLETMSGVLGRDTLDRVMRAYHQKFRFHHPTAKDFQQVTNEVSGRNMDWFFDQFWFGNKRLDYEVSEVVNRERKTPIGIFDQGGKRITVTRKEADEKDKKNDDNKSYKKQYDSVVKIRRNGDAVVPVEVVIHFKDGVKELRNWDGEYRWVKYTFQRGSEIDWVEIDPYKKYQLDVSYANNSWRMEYNKALSTSWSARLLFWVQNVMLAMTAMV